MIYIRGQQAGYDSWAAQGATGWDWQSVKPYFLKMENHFNGESEWHGSGGPLRIEPVDHTQPLSQKLVNAAMNMGLTYNDDFNGGDQEGVGFYQATINNGRRCSTAKAYLNPTPNTPNTNDNPNNILTKQT